MRSLFCLVLVTLTLSICPTVLHGGSKKNKSNEHTIYFPEKPSFEQIKQQAAESGKKIYVLVSSDTNGWCKFMKQMTLTNHYLAMYINRFYIPVEANRSTPEGKKFAPELNKPGYPRIYILDQNGKVLKDFIGAYDLPGSELNRLLNNFEENKNAMSKLFNDMLKIAKKRKPPCDSASILAKIAEKVGRISSVRKYYGKKITPQLSGELRCNSYVWFWTRNKSNLESALEVGKKMVKECKNKKYLSMITHTLAWCYYENKCYPEAVENMKKAKSLLKKSDKKSHEEYQKDLDKFTEKLSKAKA